MVSDTAAMTHRTHPEDREPTHLVNPSALHSPRASPVNSAQDRQSSLSPVDSVTLDGQTAPSQDTPSSSTLTQKQLSMPSAVQDGQSSSLTITSGGLPQTPELPGAENEVVRDTNNSEPKMSEEINDIRNDHPDVVQVYKGGVLETHFQPEVIHDRVLETQTEVDTNSMQINSESKGVQEWKETQKHDELKDVSDTQANAQVEFAAELKDTPQDDIQGFDGSPLQVVEEVEEVYVDHTGHRIDEQGNYISDLEDVKEEEETDTQKVDGGRDTNEKESSDTNFTKLKEPETQEQTRKQRKKRMKKFYGYRKRTVRTSKEIASSAIKSAFHEAQKEQPRTKRNQIATTGSPQEPESIANDELPKF